MRLRLRQQLGVALFPLGAFAVHQLRYSLAYGSGAARRLSGDGHAYLHRLMPLLVLTVALALGGLVARLARAWHGGEAERARGRHAGALWALAAAGLLAIYVGQELVEGLIATGHPQGLAAILGHGGLWALPAAIAVGGMLALVVRGGRALVAHVARLRGRALRPVASRPPRLAVARRAVVAPPRLAPLAAACAGRAPPALALPHA
jgi:hypothetical protein